MEGLYYPYSENKGADHLSGYREADLRLCFRICKKPVFSQRGSSSVYIYLFKPLEVESEDGRWLKYQVLLTRIGIYTLFLLWRKKNFFT